MITGDNEATGQTIGKQLGVDEIRANCLPEDKATILKDLQAKYKLVGMVGDGVNDAPALANADIGIAMGEGTDIAMETADVVLMKSELDKLEYCYGLSKKLKKITMQNIIFSITVILILILSNLFQLINLPLGVVGHEGGYDTGHHEQLEAVGENTYPPLSGHCQTCRKDFEHRPRARKIIRLMLVIAENIKTGLYQTRREFSGLIQPFSMEK